MTKSKPSDLLAAGGSDSSKLPLKDLLKLPNVDKKMVEIILDEIVEHKNVKFSDVGKSLMFFGWLSVYVRSIFFVLLL